MVSNYSDRRKGTWTWRIEGKVAKFRTGQRTLQDYFDALVRKGFILEGVLEPEPYPWKDDDRRDRQSGTVPR
jgi:hypothetical protein